MRNNSHESYFGSYFYGKKQQLLSCKAPEGTGDRAFLNDLFKIMSFCNSGLSYRHVE